MLQCVPRPGKAGNTGERDQLPWLLMTHLLCYTLFNQIRQCHSGRDLMWSHPTGQTHHLGAVNLPLPLTFYLARAGIHYQLEKLT